MKVFFVATIGVVFAGVPALAQENETTEPASTESTEAVAANEIIDQQQLIRDLRALLAEQEIDELEDRLEAGLEQLPDSAQLQSFHLRLYSVLSRADRTEDALKHLDAYVQYLMTTAVEDGRRLDLFSRYISQLAESRSRVGDSNQAVNVLDEFTARAEKLEGATESVLAVLATQKAAQLARAGQSAAANALMDEQVAAAAEALDANPEDPEQILRMATALKGRVDLLAALEAGDPEPARADLLAFLSDQAQAHPEVDLVVQQYLAELMSRAGALSRSDPDQADELLKRIEDFVENAGADATIPRMYGQASIARLRERIETARKMLALVGSPAVYPENVDAWVNGDEMTPGSLEGKVVLLDFFAVWCGPCIATFPHLRQWYDDFAEEGLEIIGVTRYYQYGWDDDAQRPLREDELDPEKEHEAMQRFLDHHQLRHRVAYISDRQLQQHYMVSGIPHALLIDRHGKVNLFRIGSGTQNAHDLEEAIKACLADAPDGSRE